MRREMKQDLHPEELASSLRAHPCVALVGAGASVGAPTRAPDWVGFIHELLAALMTRAASLSPELPESAIDFTPGLDPESVVQILREELCLPTDRFFEFVHALDGLEVNSNHRALAALAREGLVAHFVTTNFDDCLERALAACGVPHAVHWESEGAAELLFTLTRDRPDRRVHVLKIHGTASDFDSVLMTENDVVLPLSEFSVKAVEELLARFPVLVFGYSGRDRDIMPILVDVGDRSPGAYWCLFDGASGSPSSEQFMREAAGQGGYVEAGSGFLSRLAQAAGIEVPASDGASEAETRSWVQRVTEWAKRAEPGDACLAVARVLVESHPDAAGRALVSTLLKAAAGPRAASRLGHASLSVRARLLRARLLLSDRGRRRDEGEEATSALVAASMLRPALEELGDPDRAIGSEEVYSRLGEVARRVAWPTRERLTAEALVVLGRAAERASERGQARELFARALETLVRADHMIGRNQAYLGLARCERNAGSLQAASSALASALFHSFVEGDARCLFESLLETAELCLACLRSPDSGAGTELGLVTTSAQAETAVSALHAAREYARGPVDEERLASIEGSSAQRFAELGLAPPAPRPFLRLLKEQGWSPHTDLRNTAGMMRIQVAQLNGEFEDARRELEIGFRAAQLLGDATQQALWKTMRAEHFLNNERPFEALLLLEEVLPRFEDHPKAHMLFQNLATAYRRIGWVEESQRFLERAAGPGGERAFQKGQQLLAEKRYPEALSAFERAARAAESGEERLELAHALHQVGLVHQRMNQLEEAETHYLRSLAIQRELPKVFLPEEGPSNNPGLLAATLGSLGAVYLRRGAFDRAMEFFVESYHRFDAMKSPHRRLIESYFHEVQEAVGEERWRELYERERARLLKMISTGGGD